ncbi:MAG TPA: hypothetical protein VGX52_20435 [Burkholderiales bacterium]|nr:hypothetical protein [Burkholderiales bacterium]
MRLVLWLSLFWAFPVAAQEECKAIEQRFAGRPLVMAQWLAQASCIGGARDAQPVTKAVRRLVPRGRDLGEQELGEIGHLVDQALAEIAAYLEAETRRAQSAELARILAALSRELEEARATTAKRLPLGERDTKGWEWQTNNFPGLPSVNALLPRLATCDKAVQGACTEAEATARAVFRTTALTGQALDFSARPNYYRALAAARVRDAQWDAYFNQARMQWPHELFVNGWLYGRANEKANGFADVPRSQWILLHPGIGMEYVRSAEAGSRFEPSLVLEVIGYNRWSWGADGAMRNAIGISFIQTYSDRAGTGSARPGVMLHFRNKFSLAYTHADGKSGLMLSTDLAPLFSRVEEDVRSRFRLRGTGRGPE